MVVIRRINLEPIQEQVIRLTKKSQILSVGSSYDTVYLNVTMDTRLERTEECYVLMVREGIDIGSYPIDTYIGSTDIVTERTVGNPDSIVSVHLFKLIPPRNYG